MNLISITKSDIKNILHSRVNTKIVIWDIENQWQEIEVIGDLTIFAKTFFEDSDYKKIEMGFLLHNINILLFLSNLLINAYYINKYKLIG